MCQRGLRREPCNEGLLLLLLAGVLLLFSPSPPGSSILPGCEARLLPLEDESFVHGATRGEEGRGEANFLGQILAAGKVSSPPPKRAPKPAPAIAPNAAASTGTKRAPKQAPKPAPAIAPIAAASKVTKSKGVSLFWLYLVGPAVFLIFVATVIAAKVRLVVRKRRREAGTTWKKGLSFHDNEQLAKYTFAGVPTITFEELEAACEEFTNVIGTSADCFVFKGTRVSDGVPIAVARMRIPPERWTPKREIGFRHKVEDLARMSHDNMVNLIAYCATDGPFERILVFEYASNGTLYEHLHARGAAEDHLDWPMRMRIVMGAACGLEYLHHKLIPPTSHFKFDARHVFLTEDYAAKLADFAVSQDSGELNVRSLGKRKSFARIATAVGYNEWEAHKHTPNLDSNIRSFGVFLLEVITGRRPYTETQGPLVDWAKEYLSDAEKMRLMVDPSLKDYKKVELEAICETAKMCLRPKGNRLPTMNELADMLSKALRMSREAANCKTSPLLWAEMQLLSSMEHSLDDASLGANSPKNPSANFPTSLVVNSPDSRKLTSQGSGNKLGSPRRPVSPGATKKTLSRDGSGNNEQHTAAVKLPKLSANSLSSKRSWGASNRSELELLSLADDDSSGSESLEIPLAASIISSSYIPSSRGSLDSGRSFRRVWAENATEMGKLESRSSGHLSR